MFNPEKILGGLLRSTSRGGMFGGNLGKGAVGLGLLGVAVAAVEHFMEKNTVTQQGGPPSMPPGNVPPPRPSSPSTSVPPPPPPGIDLAAPPPPPPGQAPSGVGTSEGDAVLLIRAMIAAANADGNIDQEERRQILEKLKALQLTPEEHGFIVQELLAPCGLDVILQGVKTPELAKEVYAVSLMAIEVDTEAERDYIRQLAEGLGIDPSTRREIHRELGIEGV